MLCCPVFSILLNIEEFKLKPIATHEATLHYNMCSHCNLTESH